MNQTFTSSTVIDKEWDAVDVCSLSRIPHHRVLDSEGHKVTIPANRSGRVIRIIEDAHVYECRIYTDYPERGGQLIKVVQPPKGT